MANRQQQGAADDWEQAADTDQSLSDQTSRININANAPSFRPQATSFVPGGQQQQYYAQQPAYGQASYQTYGNQAAYGQYPQGQYSYQQGGHPGAYGGYGGGYGNQYANQYGGQQAQYQPQVLQRGQELPTQPKPGTVERSYLLTVDAPKSSGLPSLPPPRAPISGNSVTSAKGPAEKAKVLKIGSSPKPIEKDEKPAEKPVEKKEEKPVAPPVEEAKAAPEKKPSSKPSSNQPSRPPSADPEKEPESREADAVIKEQEEEVDETVVQDMYGKEHVNIVFIGHVDAGKSTLGGNILFLTGMVDERTMEKYEKEAKEAGRESWYLSWALDSTKEERAKGKTVEVGRARFETERRRYTILDAPGHKSYVPNMISGAAQADVGVLVISARKGEFETGFDKGGQTREHAVLAKMQGINKLIVVINKMDDPTVEWSKERFVLQEDQADLDMMNVLNDFLRS